MSKVTSLEVASRVNEVYMCILNGYNRKRLMEYSSKWKCAERTVDTYIRKARDKFEKIVKTKQEYHLGVAIDRLNEVYYHAFNDGDWRCCVAAVKALTDIIATRGIDTGVSAVDWDYEAIEEGEIKGEGEIDE